MKKMKMTALFLSTTLCVSALAGCSGGDTANTGNWITDATYGSRSLLMNLKTREWDDELLGIFEVDREKLCDIAEPGSIVGTVTSEAAEKTGLPEGIPVISAGGDQQSAALGLGVLKEGTMEVSVGTGGYIIAASDGYRMI